MMVLKKKKKRRKCQPIQFWNFTLPFKEISEFYTKNIKKINKFGCYRPISIYYTQREKWPIYIINLLV